MAIAVATPRRNAQKTMKRFWWADLSSTDDGGSADFYSRIFGWSYDEMPIGDGMVHRNAKLGDLYVAGMDPVMPGSEFPTAWTNFVFVSDIDATIADVTRLGGTVVMEPMDVMGEGHMAVFMDPQGAACGLWQPGRHTGADAVNQPGTVTWVELATDDVEGAMTFYGALFGWGFEQFETGPDMDYWVISLDGVAFAGLMAKPADMGGMPSLWATYLGVADVDEAAAEVAAAGGRIIYGPAQLGPGRGIGIIDPQGGYVVAFQYDEWPAD